MLRFPVARERDMRRFMDLSDLVAADRATPASRSSGSARTALMRRSCSTTCGSTARDYDRVLFWAYRYADTYFGLPLVADRAVLVPTAEEDPLIHVDALERVLRAAARASCF